MTKNERHSNAVDLVRDILGDDDPQFAEDLERQIQGRQLVRLLATIRNSRGVTQGEVAKEIGCGQGKISKLENGTDDSVTMGEIEAYAKATDCDVEFVFRSRDMTLVDEIKSHAFSIRRCFDRLNGLAKDDETVSRGVAKFHLEALYNLANIIKTSAENLKSNDTKGHVHIRKLEEQNDFDQDMDCAHDQESPDHEAMVS